MKESEQFRLLLEMEVRKMENQTIGLIVIGVGCVPVAIVAHTPWVYVVCGVVALYCTAICTVNLYDIKFFRSHLRIMRLVKRAFDDALGK